ncbi:MAG: signal peptidase I [Bauldia sp.]|uniref:signal peptidase I n=1 Tax=Bauldia sp. TaxID=2575872 RepID=UPI001DB51D40|nr:signal peptidase I [Bauldia sp.]MCB1496019.1 signal peptidase I [Bauldia sp.]
MCATLLMLTLAVTDPAATVFTIPSVSGVPGLMPGDAIVVLSYTAERQPERGDLAVYRGQQDRAVHNVHRIVGLPGERIQMIGGALLIDGEAVERTEVGAYRLPETHGGREDAAGLYRETLPGGVTFETLDIDPDGFLDDTPVFDVPADSYFVLGDNRDNAADSRISAVGAIPRADLAGYVDRVACRGEAGR